MRLLRAQVHYDRAGLEAIEVPLVALSDISSSDSKIASLLGFIPCYTVRLERETSMNTSDTLLTRKEAAEHLRLCTRSIDQYIAKGELRAVRLGRKVLIPREAVSEFIVARTRIPATANPSQNRTAA
jgi:excisionase family DNA binding protein